jgi:hypothetical protein
MPSENDKAVDERIAEFDEALVNLERANSSGDGKDLARGVQQARIILYVGSKQIEHLQPSADQWAMIDDRLERLARWLAKYD